MNIVAEALTQQMQDDLQSTTGKRQHAMAWAIAGRAAWREKIQGCWCCKKQVQPGHTCEACLVARYCSLECQSNHWPAHKNSCTKCGSHRKRPTAREMVEALDHLFGEHGLLAKGARPFGILAGENHDSQYAAAMTRHAGREAYAVYRTKQHICYTLAEVHRPFRHVLRIPCPTHTCRNRQ